jgi:hypothetical protein
MPGASLAFLMTELLIKAALPGMMFWKGLPARRKEIEQ